MKKINIVLILCFLFGLFAFLPSATYASSAVPPGKASKVPVSDQLFKFDDSPQVYIALTPNSPDGTIYNGIGFIPVMSPAYLSILQKYKPVVTYPAAARNSVLYGGMDIMGPCPFNQFLPDGVVFSPNHTDIYVAYLNKANYIASMDDFYRYGYALSDVHWNTGPIDPEDLSDEALPMLQVNLPGTILRVRNTPDYYILTNTGARYISNVAILAQELDLYPVVDIEQITLGVYGIDTNNDSLLPGNLVKYGSSFYIVGTDYTAGMVLSSWVNISPSIYGPFDNVSKVWYIPSMQELIYMGYDPAQAIQIDHDTFVSLHGEDPLWHATTDMIQYWWDMSGMA